MSQQKEFTNSIDLEHEITGTTMRLEILNSQLGELQKQVKQKQEKIKRYTSYMSELQRIKQSKKNTNFEYFICVDMQQESITYNTHRNVYNMYVFKNSVAGIDLVYVTPFIKGNLLTRGYAYTNDNRKQLQQDVLNAIKKWNITTVYFNKDNNLGKTAIEKAIGQKVQIVNDFHIRQEENGHWYI